MVNDAHVYAVAAFLLCCMFYRSVFFFFGSFFVWGLLLTIPSAGVREGCFAFTRMHGLRCRVMKTWVDDGPGYLYFLVMYWG